MNSVLLSRLGMALRGDVLGFMSPLARGYKVKTKQAAKKRMLVKSSGDLKHGRACRWYVKLPIVSMSHAGCSHKTGKKSRTRIRELGNTTLIQVPAVHRNMKRLLGM